MIRILSTLLVASLLLAGIALPRPAEAACERDSTGGILGAIGGAIAGGLLGSQFGGGRGKLALTAGGAVLGGLLGNEVGRRLTCSDQEQISSTTQTALEEQPTGEQIAWNNPDSGNSGTVTPTKTWQRADGTYCREFQQTILVDGQSEQAYGTACRQPDGAWQIQP